MIKRDNEAMHESAARRILDDYKMHQSGGPTGKKQSRLALWGVAIVSVLVLFFAVSLLFAKASVTVTPKTADVSLDNTAYTAEKDAVESQIGFQLVSYSGEESTTIPAEKTGEKVTQKASGTIVIFNEFSTTPQKLIANTRFETPDGKIYRIDAPVSVPGYTMKAGKKEPGSLKVLVTADQPGESYNIGLTDFTLPGLKGDARFTTVYARSDTPMTGGATGIVNSVSAESYAAAKSTLDAALKDKLVAQLRAQVPAGYVLFDDAVTFTPDPSSKGQNLYSTTTSIPVMLKGTVTAVLVDEAALAARIAKDNVSQYDGSSVIIPHMNELDFALTTTTPITAETTQIAFTVSGNGQLVWTFDKAALAASLAGEPKADFKSILKGYSGIDTAQVTLRPFWKMSFPDKAESIIISDTVLGE